MRSVTGWLKKFAASEFGGGHRRRPDHAIVVQMSVYREFDNAAHQSPAGVHRRSRVRRGVLAVAVSKNREPPTSRPARSLAVLIELGRDGGWLSG